ncbi:tetratricopeptide repeat protein [Streptomyces sp. CBMA123]|uniref:tetratricopeptide repeat protein n=1 Tax=Streptomyces sp. CBMA123 TaxID=1896313 RepID=UPI001661BD43|nr:tetratricopeptide repeat protein [Streptomyces sp. CBMA123]MBD0693915.1 hypothetical protein [Streptomyces sp. CBMA123]
MAVLRTGGAHHHRLGPLPSEAARQLLAVTAGRAGHGRDLAVLADRCRGVPLALTLAGARLAASHTTLPMAAPVAGTPMDAIVTHALDQAYSALSPETAAVFRALGALPLPSTRIDAAMAGAACALDPAATDGHLTTLVKHGLITPADDGPDLYVFAVADGRRHAAALGRDVGSPEQIDTVRRRALDWLQAEATAASRAAHPFRRHAEPHLRYPPPHRVALTTPEQGLAWLRTRGTYLRTALETADAHGLDDITAHLAHAFWPWLLRERNYPRWLWTYELAVPAAQRLTQSAPSLASRFLLSDLFGARCNVRRATGDHGGAIEDRGAALALAIEDKDDIGRAQHLHGLGVATHASGDPEVARVYLNEALCRRSALGNQRDTGVTRVALAVALYDLGEADTALACLREARAELHAAGDGLNTGRALAWQGRILAERGEHGPAVAFLAGALNIFIVQNARPWQGRVLLWAAESAGGQGNTNMAREMLRHAREPYAGSPSDLEAVAAAADRLGIAL